MASLFTLPTEVRLHILSFVVAFNNSFIVIHAPGDLFPYTDDLNLWCCLNSIGIFTVSRQLREEALHTFFYYNTFINRVYAIKHIRAHQTKWWMSRIRHFRLDIHVYDAENLLSSDALDQAAVIFAQFFGDLKSLKSLQIDVAEHSLTKGPVSECLSVLLRQIRTSATIYMPQESLDGRIIATNELEEGKMRQLIRAIEGKIDEGGIVEDLNLQPSNAHSSATTASAKESTISPPK